VAAERVLRRVKAAWVSPGGLRIRTTFDLLVRNGPSAGHVKDRRIPICCDQKCGVRRPVEGDELTCRVIEEVYPGELRTAACGCEDPKDSKTSCLCSSRGCWLGPKWEPNRGRIEQ